MITKGVLKKVQIGSRVTYRLGGMWYSGIVDEVYKNVHGQRGSLYVASTDGRLPGTLTLGEKEDVYLVPEKLLEGEMSTEEVRAFLKKHTPTTTKQSLINEIMSQIGYIQRYFKRFRVSY